MTIERFRDDYFFLSNMYPLNIPITTRLGVEVYSSEQVYMADRFADPVVQLRVALARGPDDDQRIYKDGLAAKELAHELISIGEEQIAEFEVVKGALMYIAVSKKFSANPDIAEKLIDTADEELVEGNDWGDRYWGVSPIGSKNGLNKLGKILMQVRSELRLSTVAIK